MQLVRDLMSTGPITVPPYTSITSVASCMRDANVGCVLITSEGALHGILTDRDVTVRIAAEGTIAGAATALSAVSGVPVTVASDVSVCEAACLMMAHSVRRLPVVDEGCLVGLITLGDLASTAHAQEVLVALSRAKPNH
ncbi:CBS domain-containing protein [Streptomyces sp. AK02-01A]|uniref:CBS domain-containing protein n=1 Tax=Streptomyces sp. AK02-01A TaxID=3028648 RepID=UPI0029BC61C2|nr:CBS domain-containing protein [Streptomyces sp. AK02-01A]MDX3853344.1 CBS domain-containing protein [Streptomyces sp. AK02-01A]